MNFISLIHYHYYRQNHLVGVTRSLEEECLERQRRREKQLDLGQKPPLPAVAAEVAVDGGVSAVEGGKGEVGPSS